MEFLKYANVRGRNTNVVLGFRKNGSQLKNSFYSKMPVTRFRRNLFRINPVQQQFDLKNNLVFQQLEKEENGSNNLVRSYHPLQLPSFFANVCTPIPRPRGVGFNISPYNDLVPKLITIRINGERDPVSNIVETF